MAVKVNIVPHTHWDREWYKPFPVFRMQLVELIDLLLDQLEADPDFNQFQLDGQMAAIDDYLEIRPEHTERLRGLAEAGRITIGPWYTLPDEFLVSGETHVRNLALGIARAAEFGGTMEVGYLPDMFGHIAQMPQILRGFGFSDAVVWRGVPAAVTTPMFRWVAPDGSSVRAEYLPAGYGNGARPAASGEELVRQVESFREAVGELAGDPVLWMNGTDHQLPDRNLPRIVAEANASGGDLRFEITTLARHLEARTATDLPEWEGELRSGARSNLLMGTASARVDVKIAAARAERSLERVAEPLSALWTPVGVHPKAFIDHAWRDVVRNAAHDSICGCSTDEVNDAVLHRYAESTRIAEAVADRAGIRILGASGEGSIVLNPTSRPRRTTAAVIVPGDVPPPDTQQLEVRPARHRAYTVDAEAGPAVVLRAVLEDPKVIGFEFLRDGSEAVVVLDRGRGDRSVDEARLREEIRALEADPSLTAVHVEHRRDEASQQVLVRSTTVAGFGWSGLAPSDLGDHAVRFEDGGLTNGLVTIGVDRTHGTFSLNGIGGFGRLVDDGDAGDTYNWSPPAADLVVDEPERVDVAVPESGPVRGRIEIRRVHRIPERIEDGRRCGAVELHSRMIVELHAGEDLVRVRVEIDNRARDHRLRIHLPLPRPAEHSEAECAFGSVTRGLTAEGGPNETGLPTFPSRRFVRAGGLTVVHEGLCEYELVDIRTADGSDEEQTGGTPAGVPRAHSLAVTLLRSVGLLSNGPMTMRALPAGPETPVPGAQLPGVHTFDLALHLGDRDPWALADEVFTPMPTFRAPGRGFGDPTAGAVGLRVEGAEVSALRRRDDGRVELRVFNPTPEAATVMVSTGDGDPVHGTPTDLAGRDEPGRFEGSAEIGPHRIRTWALDL